MAVNALQEFIVEWNNHAANLLTSLENVWCMWTLIETGANRVSMLIPDWHIHTCAKWETYLLEAHYLGFGCHTSWRAGAEHTRSAQDIVGIQIQCWCQYVSYMHRMMWVISLFCQGNKMFPLFRLSLDDKSIVWPRAIILSSGNNLNMGNTFACLTEWSLQSNSDNNYLLQTDVLSRFRLYAPAKI